MKKNANKSGLSFLLIFCLILDIYKCSEYLTQKNKIIKEINNVKKAIQSQLPPPPPFRERERHRFDDLNFEQKRLEDDIKRIADLNEDMKIELMKYKIYLKLLTISGIIFLLVIIIFGLVKLYSICRNKNINAQNNIFQNENILLRNLNHSLIDDPNNKLILLSSSSNSQGNQSRYNLLKDSKENINNIDENSLDNKKNITQFDEDDNKNSGSNSLSIGKNFDAPQIAFHLDEKIDNDNKTLTNNPDAYFSSKADKKLYKPYVINENK